MIDRIFFELLKRLPEKRIALPHKRSPHPRFAVAPTELGFVLGRHEEEVFQHFLNQIRNQDGKVIDVGAHIGVYTVFAAVSGSGAIAIEPSAENAARIRGNAVRNDVSEMISVWQAAAWSHSGSVSLYQNSDAAQHRIADNGNETVEAVELDSRLDPQNICLVKIDVEGTAKNVLAGAGNLIHDGDATWIIEYHSKDEKKGIDAAFDDSYNRTEISDRHLMLTRP